MDTDQDSPAGLWKFTFALPRYGTLDVVLEVESTTDGAPVYLCLNDQHETLLADVQWRDRRLTGTARVMGLVLALDLQFAGAALEGTITRDPTRVPVHGRAWDPSGQAPAPNPAPASSSPPPPPFHPAPPETGETPGSASGSAPHPAPHPAPRPARVDRLLAAMTLEEKVGQLYQMPGAGTIPTGPDGTPADPTHLIRTGRVGSVLGVMTACRAETLQRVAVEESRLGIPLLFMADVIHGLRTIFPIPLAMASSWDVAAIERAARVAAKESVAAGIHVTFSPMVDVARDPRWGRVMEGAGEDPYLGCQCAAAQVRGYQGAPTDDQARLPADAISACVKHYAGYGGAEGGRDYNTVDMSEYRLRNVYLPPYRAAVDAGAGWVMSSFNSLLGEPVTGNAFLLRDVLRGEWGFVGATISDYNSVVEMVAHGVVADEREAAARAMRATLDVEMVSRAYPRHLPALVREGVIAEDLVDAAVRRVLETKARLGLFEDPLRGASEARAAAVHLCPEHRATARDVARRSMVLLKNEPHPRWNRPVLPLDASILGDVQTIALVGPFAKDRGLIGSWSALGRHAETVSLETALREHLADLLPDPTPAPTLVVIPGCSLSDGVRDRDGHPVRDSTLDRLHEKHRARVNEVVEAAATADLVILALGERETMSGEAKCRAYLGLPGLQGILAREVLALGKPTVAVLFNGRPLVLDRVAEAAPAILEAWYPGTEGARAVVDVLVGRYNPAGKLPVSFPVTEGQVPVYYAHDSTGRPQFADADAGGFKSRYLDASNAPLYPFGHGLSYTTFTVSPVKVRPRELSRGEALTASVEVTNTGSRPGEVVVQLYVQDVVGRFVRPVRELKGFQKIHLAARASREVVFSLVPAQLRYWRPDAGWTAEPGDFLVFVGLDATTTNQAGFRLS